MTASVPTVVSRSTMWLVHRIIAPTTDTELLAPLRLTMIRVALTLGWVSAAVVLVGALSASWHAAPIDHLVILTLVASAASVNGLLGLMPWRRWMGTPRAELALAVWAAAVVVLVSVFVHLGGYWASDYYLLYFLVIPFIAATEPPGRQAVLFVMAIAGYLVATLTSRLAAIGSDVAIHVVMLAGACVLSGFLAQAISQTTRDRARAEAAAKMERLLADEAHHRIKNNLQLIGDLLSMEAAKEGNQLLTVVDETLSRIQSVAAVHQALATAGGGRVALRPVVDRIVALLADRLGGGRSVVVSGGDGSQVEGRRATWTALVVNELLTNALRHGKGTVRVDITGAEDQLVLRVGDEGPGPGPAPHGLGLALVSRIVEDGLEGRIISGACEAGWTVEVVFLAGGSGAEDRPTEAEQPGKELTGAGADSRG